MNSIAQADATLFSTPNILVCFEHSDGEASKSATALKNVKSGLKLDSSYFKDLWFLDPGARPSGSSTTMAKQSRDTSQPGDSGTGAAVSKISYIEMLGLTWARNIQSGGPNYRSRDVNANLILPQKGETPLDFAIRIIKRLKYFSGDPNEGLYSDIVKIAFGKKSAEQDKYIGAKLNFDKSGMSSVVYPLGNIAAGEKMAAELPDPNNCIITTYSQQIESSTEGLTLDEMPKALMRFDARLIGSGDPSIHKFESRGIAFLDQILYYVSRHLYGKQDSDYTYILADLLKRDLTLQKLENDLAEYGFNKYPRRDPLVLELNKFIAESTSSEVLGSKIPYPNIEARKKLWKDLFNNKFIPALSQPNFSYVPNEAKQEVVRLMSDAMDRYWQKYVVEVKSSGASSEANLDVFLNRRVLPNFPTDLIIPVGGK